MVGTVFFCRHIAPSKMVHLVSVVYPESGGNSKKIYYTVRAEKSTTKVFYSEKKLFLCPCKIGKPDW